VVHDGEQPYQRVADDLFQHARHFRRRELAAQMQDMFGLQRAEAGEGAQILQPGEEGVVARGLEPDIAETQRVEHRGDAGGHTLRIVRRQG
jgi:hypothetical protein